MTSMYMFELPKKLDMSPHENRKNAISEQTQVPTSLLHLN